MRESGYYPAGAEFDPRAPWNQEDLPEWDGEFSYYVNEGGVLEILLEIEGASSYPLDADYLFENLPEGEWEWWINAIKDEKVRKSKEFDEKLTKLVNEYVNNNEIDWEWANSQDEKDAAAEDAYERMRDERYTD